MQKNLGFYDRTLRGGLGIMLTTFGLTSSLNTANYFIASGIILFSTALIGWSLAYKITQLSTLPEQT